MGEASKPSSGAVNRSDAPCAQGDSSPKPPPKSHISLDLDKLRAYAERSRRLAPYDKTPDEWSQRTANLADDVLRLIEQLEAAQAAIRELHEEMWTVRDGDGYEYVSGEGMRYLRRWFERTNHLIGEASTPAMRRDADQRQPVDAPSHVDCAPSGGEPQ